MAAPEDQRRRRRVQYASLAAFLAVGVVIALIVISQTGGDEENGGDAGNVQGAAEIESLLEGIPQQGEVLGSPDAPLTITEFADPQCPACKSFADQVVPTLVDERVRGGEAKLEYRTWVILGPDSELAAKAVLAAGEQDRLWQFVELFYRNQGGENSGYVTDEFLESLAKGAGVPDLERFNEDRADPRWDSVLAEVDREATDLGFGGTPSIVVEGPRGREALKGFGLGEIEAALSQASG